MQRADCRIADFDAYVSGAAIIAGTILTAARTGETFEIRYYELQGNTWVTPDKRIEGRARAPRTAREALDAVI